MAKEKVIPKPPGFIEKMKDFPDRPTLDSLEGFISEESLKSIREMDKDIVNLTEIQAKTLPYILDGKDLVGAAKTGSGKTIAFLLPAIENLKKKKFTKEMGAGLIVLSPTRELSIQTYGIVEELVKHHSLSKGLLIGGTSMQGEFEKLSQGINILIATPGRLIDHLQKNKNFVFENLKCLVVDEADRLLDDGFEEQVKTIIRLIPKKRQTLLFSATLSDKTKGLAKFALKKDYISVGLEHKEEVATVDGLVQGYLVVDAEKRFLYLYSLLKRIHKTKKTIVFFSSCMAVKFYFELLNYIDLPVLAYHGRQNQSRRTETFKKFIAAEKGILLCTDVAARGLDIEGVDWIIQYDPPDRNEEYIHRVGRTARKEGAKGEAILFLRPEEKPFLKYLEEAKVPVEEFIISQSKVFDIQIKLERLIMKSYSLHLSALEAYKSFVRAYASHSLKDAFNIDTLDLKQIAKSFGFPVAPAVDLRMSEYKLCQPRRATRISHNKKPYSRKN